MTVPIECKTCGKSLESDDDALSYFEAGHELPTSKELLNRFPADEVTDELYLVILMCEMVRRGQLRYVGGRYFNATSRLGAKN